ncbi:MAG: hypothetical protein J6Y94_04560 [Bacteriovoracaceae bacterium]|nr:hypothetical protein [Bacteriovoracaceae bacterium]
MKHLLFAILLTFSFAGFAQDQAPDQASKQQFNENQEIKSVSGGECLDTSAAGCPAMRGDLSQKEAKEAKGPYRENKKKGDKEPGKGIEQSE